MTGRRLTHPGEKKPQRAILKEKSRQLPQGEKERRQAQKRLKKLRQKGGRR